MKVLVTGANGFLASNVIRELLARGMEVRGMIRENCNRKSLQGINIELVHGNIVSYPDVRSSVEGCDVVIHAAADTSQFYSDPLPLFAVNVNGTNNVIKAAKEFKVKRLIFVSTANTINLDKKASAWGKDISRYYKKSGYALSKYKAEQLILNETDAGSLDAVIVNPTFMIGAFDAKPSSGRIFMLFLKKKIVFYPPGGKNFVDVKCAATAICNAIESGRSGDRYLLSGVNLSYREFLDALDKVEKNRSCKVMIPSVLLTAAGLTGSLLRKAGFRTELNYYNARILSTRETISGEKAEKELSMPETDISKAIQDAVKWFKENGYLGSK
jgi:dihydroflavonol-4-reductase